MTNVGRFDKQPDGTFSGKRILPLHKVLPVCRRVVSQRPPDAIRPWPLGKSTLPSSKASHNPHVHHSQMMQHDEPTLHNDPRRVRSPSPTFETYPHKTQKNVQSLLHPRAGDQSLLKAPSVSRAASAVDRQTTVSGLSSKGLKMVSKQTRAQKNSRANKWLCTCEAASSTRAGKGKPPKPHHKMCAHYKWINDKGWPDKVVWLDAPPVNSVHDLFQAGSTTYLGHGVWQDVDKKKYGMILGVKTP